MVVMFYHGVKTSAKIMGSDENMVRTVGTIPEREGRGDEINGGGNKGTSMPDSWEAINGAKIAGNINRDEEEIGFIWVKCSYIAF